MDTVTAMARGEIIDRGEDGISEHGFVYDSNAVISANAQRLQLGSRDVTGSYESPLTNLRPHTRYYVNTFLMNGSETTYGDPVSFFTAMNLPEVKTEAFANITDSTVTVNGEVVADGGAAVYARGFCWGTFPQPSLFNDHIVNGSGTGKFYGSLNQLKKDSTYFVRAYASNNAGTAYGNELIFKAGQAQSSPTVITAEITAIAQTTAVSGGEVISDGGTPVTERGVCWSATPYPTIGNSTTADGNGTGSYPSSIGGLTANTTYYLRAYATNATGTSYGEEKTFKTLADPVVPTVITASVTQITTTTAQSGGTVLESGGASVGARGVCWATTPNPTIANSKTTDGEGVGSFTSAVFGLTANTGYYLRAYATNSVGTGYGNEINFTAGQTITTPTIITAEVVNIAQTTATCGGNVTSDGGADVTIRGVCWSTSPNPTTASSTTNNGGGTGGYHSAMAGMAANTHYYVRAYATNSAGTSYGNQREFSTLQEATTPAVTTAPVTNVTNATAQSGGTVTNDGGATVTARGVCWSTGTNPTVADPHTSDGTGTGGFVSQITGLQPNTFYRVRAYATNSAGTAYGNQQTFSTLENPVLPTVSTAQAMNITATTATTGGTINSDGGSTVTARGVCYSTTSTPTLANPHTTDGSGMGTFVSNLASLTPNTTYYIRAYATNGVGTSYGNQIIITTLAAANLPSVLTTVASIIGQTTATCGGNVTSDGGATVTARGVCWSITANPTTANSHTTDGTGTGSFISNLTGLNPGTSYYYRAYATNSVGTAYGIETMLTTQTASTCGSSITINHVAGAVAPVTKSVTYGTVTNIPGEPSKCWITSNLGADHQATAVNDATEASAGWYWQFNRKQGYKHDGATRTPNTAWIGSISENSDWTSTNDPCNIELGITWRIPTYTEWYNVDNIGGWTTWNGPWDSGVKMHAAGFLNYGDGSLTVRGSYGYYWSSTQGDATTGWNLFFNNFYSIMNSNYKAYGFSTRCISD